MGGFARWSHREQRISLDRIGQGRHVAPDGVSEAFMYPQPAVEKARHSTWNRLDFVDIRPLVTV